MKGPKLTKSTEKIIDAISVHLGNKNVASVFYPMGKGSVYNTIANVECLDAAVYKQYVRTLAIFYKECVEFQPHPNSLDGNAKLDDRTLKNLRFLDVNTTLANTITTLQNATASPKHDIMKEDITLFIVDRIPGEPETKA